MTVDRNAWDRVEEFLNTNSFDGFTSDKLFIMNFIKKGWGPKSMIITYSVK